MSVNGQAQDEAAGLLARAAEVERLGDTIFRAAEGRRDLPKPLGETLKQIADLAAACEEALAEGLPAETVEALAVALGAIRGGIDAVVVYQALEGTSYSTTTVAND